MQTTDFVEVQENKVFMFAKFFIVLKGTLRKVVIYYRETCLSSITLCCINMFSDDYNVLFSLRRIVRTAK